MTIIDRPPSTTRTTTTRLRSWQPYLLLIFMLLSLFLAYQWWQTTRNWNATQGSLEDTLNTLLKAQEDLQAEQEKPLRQEQELEEVKQQLKDARDDLAAKEKELTDLRKDQEDLKICEQDALTICSPPLADDLPQLEFTKGQGQIDEKYSSILLLGERENRHFPRRSFYESVGVFTLNSGSWSLSANGIGGREDTGASAISLEWDATPQSCIEQPNGSWERAFQVDCEVRFEWTVQSRYPYSTLQLIPIESVIPPEEEP